MDVYDSELKELDEKLSMQNVISDENVISLYDLYNIVNQRFEKLRSVTQNNAIFCNKEIFNQKKYKEVIFSIGKDTSQITIFQNMRFDSSFNICKDQNNNDFYLIPHYKTSRKFMNNFVVKYYDELMYAFSIMEEYSLLINSPLDFVFKCGQYYLKIYIDSDGNVYLKLVDNFKDKNSKEIFLENHDNRELLLKKLEESKIELSKKIAVNIDSLNESLQNIVRENFAEKEKVKQKVVAS